MFDGMLKLVTVCLPIFHQAMESLAEAAREGTANGAEPGDPRRHEFLKAIDRDADQIDPFVTSMLEHIGRNLPFLAGDAPFTP